MTEKKLYSMLGAGRNIEINQGAKILQDFIRGGYPQSLLSSIPTFSEIDWGATPPRTNKRITFKCSAPITDVKEQDLRGTAFKFTQRVSINVYVRAIKSEGLRLGREPDDLIAIEKWVTEYLALNRLSLEDEGIQYVEILNAQTTPEVMGNEEIQQTYYHLNMTVVLHYWLRATIVP